MRQWHMLRLIPRFPSKVSTSELVHSLADEGFEVTRRTLQRDLAKLTVIYWFVMNGTNPLAGHGVRMRHFWIFQVWIHIQL